jgi:hypothetical protein
MYSTITRESGQKILYHCARLWKRSIMVLKLLCMLYSVGYCVLGQYVYDYNNDTYDTTSYTYDDVNDTNQFYYDYYDGK